MGRPANHLLLGLWLEVKLLLLPDGRAALARPAVKRRMLQLVRLSDREVAQAGRHGLEDGGDTITAGAEVRVLVEAVARRAVHKGGKVVVV